MHATVRRYEGVDVTRTAELTKKVGDELIPTLKKLPGFEGYYLIEAGDGVITSLSLFETAVQADESTRVAGNWIKSESLESALPNQPKITVGEVVAKSNGNARA
jgi:hypothetical protein